MTLDLTAAATAAARVNWDQAVRGPEGPNDPFTVPPWVDLTDDQRAELVASMLPLVEAAAPLIEAAALADAARRIQAFENHLPATDRYPNHTLTAGLHLAARIVRGDS